MCCVQFHTVLDELFFLLPNILLLVECFGKALPVSTVVWTFYTPLLPCCLLLQRNTFQAAIISDNCQSFAVFNYPQHGIGWVGYPPAVVAAGTTLHPDSGTPAISQISDQDSQLVYALTPDGCSRVLRSRATCLASVKNATADKSFAQAPLIQCPATQTKAALLATFQRFSTQQSSSCYRTNPLPIGNGSASSVSAFLQVLF